MNPLYSYKNQSLVAEIKDIDGRKGIVTGYFSKFDNVDADGDIIRKGAFSKTIMENGPQSSQPRIKHLMNHDVSKPLGLLTSLKEDASGLVYESNVGTHTLGVDFIKMVESGLITEHSIGFRTVKRNQLQDYEGYQKNQAGGWYEITEIKLYEGSSLTAWGANPMTPITGLKTDDAEDYLQTLVNRQKNLERFCRNSTASDETIELLLIEVKQLTQHIFTLTNKATEPVTPTLPDNTEAIKDAFKLFKQKQK